MAQTDKYAVIEGKVQQIYDKGFTEGVGSVEAVYKTSGSFTKSNDYSKITVNHGLPKAPKLVMCFRTDYTEMIDGVNTNAMCGFTYCDKVWIVYKKAPTSNQVQILVSGVPNIPEMSSHDYFNVEVNDTYFRCKDGYLKFGGDFVWEAYTW